MDQEWVKSSSDRRGRLRPAEKILQLKIQKQEASVCVCEWGVLPYIQSDFSLTPLPLVTVAKKSSLFESFINPTTGEYTVLERQRHEINKQTMSLGR